MSENAASSQDTIFTLFKEFETKMMRHFDRLEHKIDAVTIMCRDEHSMYCTKHVVPGTVNSSCSVGVSQNQPAPRSDEVQFVGLKSEIADDFPRKISYISELLRDVLEMFSTKATAETIRDREENMSNASNGSILLVAPQRLQTTALVCNDNNSHPPIPVGQIQPALMPQESTKVNSNNNCGTLLSSHPTITKPHKGPLDSQKRKREGIKGDKAMTTTGSTKLKSDTFPKPNATAPKRNRESMSGSQTPQVVRKGSSKSRRLEDEIRIAKQRMSALDTARQTHESTPNPNIHLLSVDRSPCSIEMLRQLRDQELIHALTQDKVSFPKSDIYTVLNERHLGTSMAISSCVAEYLRHCPAASMYAMKRSQRTMLREIYTVHGMCFVDELFRICGKVLLDKSLLSALASNEVVSICTGLGILADLSDRGGLVRLLTVRMLKSCSSQFPDITFKVVQALCYSSMAWGSKEASVVSRGLLHTSLHLVLQTLFGLSESSSLLEMCDHCGWPQRPMYDCDDLLHICAERLNRASISQPDLEALESFKLIILLCKDFQQSLRFLQLHFLDSPWCLSIVLDIFVHKDENCISSIDRSSAGLPKGDTKSLSLVSGHPILESAKRMVQPTLSSDPSTLGNYIVACLVLLGCYREHDFERERIVAIVKNYIQKNVNMFKGTIEGVPRSYLREFYSIVETVTGGFANKAETP